MTSSKGQCSGAPLALASRANLGSGDAQSDAAIRHPELLPPLADLIQGAASRTQVIVVTHSRPLAAALDRLADASGADLRMIEMAKKFG